MPSFNHLIKTLKHLVKVAGPVMVVLLFQVDPLGQPCGEISTASSGTTTENDVQSLNFDFFCADLRQFCVPPLCCVHLEDILGGVRCSRWIRQLRWLACSPFLSGADEDEPPLIDFPIVLRARYYHPPTEPTPSNDDRSTNYFLEPVTQQMIKQGGGGKITVSSLTLKKPLSNPGVMADVGVLHSHVQVFVQLQENKVSSPQLPWNLRYEFYLSCFSKGYRIFVHTACQSLPSVGWFNRCESSIHDLYLAPLSTSRFGSARAPRVWYLCDWVRPWNDSDRLGCVLRDTDGVNT